MGNRSAWMLVAAVAVGLTLSGCGSEAAEEVEQPAQVEAIAGSDVSRVILTEKAAERIGLQVAPVRQGSEVPLAAVVYARDGSTWVYTVTAPLTYVRQAVLVARVAGDVAVLQAGPAPGTNVVTVGAAELLGSEYGVEGE